MYDRVKRSLDESERASYNDTNIARDGGRVKNERGRKEATDWIESCRVLVD